MVTTVPVIKIPSVVHVGEDGLTPRLSDGARNSMEGNLLSVSVTPAAWTMIAKLGGGSWTSLARDGGSLAFLDYHNMPKGFVCKLVDAAVEKGLATRVQRWRAWETDEDGEERFSLHATLNEAILETEGDGRKPTPVASVEAGVALSRYWCGGERMTDFHSIDAIFACAMEKTGLDGIWWNDNYDPHSLSSPRGGIFQHKIADLQQQIISKSRHDDGAINKLREVKEKVILSDDVFAALENPTLAGRMQTKCNRIAGKARGREPDAESRLERK